LNQNKIEGCNLNFETSLGGKLDFSQKGKKVGKSAKPALLTREIVVQQISPGEVNTPSMLELTSMYGDRVNP
jgi:hypothetical protein